MNESNRVGARRAVAVAVLVVINMALFLIFQALEEELCERAETPDVSAEVVEPGALNLRRESLLSRCARKGLPHHLVVLH